MSTEIESYKQNFDKVTDSFFEQLEKLFVGNNNVSNYKTMLSFARFTGSHIDMFYMTLEPYRKQIFYKDQEFFNSKNTMSIAYSLGLTEYWSTLSDENKENVWEYFQTLYSLAYLSKGLDKDKFNDHIHEETATI